MKFSTLLASAAIALISTSAFADYNQALDLFYQAKYSESLKAIGTELDAAQDMNAAAPN